MKYTKRLRYTATYCAFSRAKKREEMTDDIFEIKFKYLAL